MTPVPACDYPGHKVILKTFSTGVGEIKWPIHARSLSRRNVVKYLLNFQFLVAGVLLMTMTLLYVVFSAK